MRFIICLLLFWPDMAPAEKPLVRDFIGLNVHTVQFKPELYQPVTRLVRDYHGFDWDVGDDTSRGTTFPLARNKVNWGTMYGAWQAAGYRINVSVMFGRTQPEAWKDLPRDSRAYGRAFGEFFGKRKLVESVEIGNEPGHYTDATYRQLFENMATGLREGGPGLQIVSCAMQAKPSGKYHKNVALLAGLEKLYDAISVHSYPFVEHWPTWRRSFPEDPQTAYRKDIQEAIDWRNAHAPGKEVWLTEFGYDASTKPSLDKWVGVTDTEQAQYIVRSYLMFSAMDLERAYLYWFNDDDKPSLHAASGLTRHYQPKPAFHAVADLLTTLGDYRFAQAVEQKPGELYVYEYRHARDGRHRVWVAWSPTGDGRSREVTLRLPAGATILTAHRMPLQAKEKNPITLRGATGQVTLTVDESPVYLKLRP